MLSVVILGTGNVAFHLAEVLSSNNSVELLQVYGRNKTKLQAFEPFCDTTDNLGKLAAAAIYLVAVSDGAIAALTQQLAGLDGVVAHTSGAVSLEVIDHPRPGVFYPLQTFTRDKKIPFAEVPICLEARHPNDLRLLAQLAGKLSGAVHRIDSAQRRQLHLAAIWVNNFTNHLLYIGQQLCEEKGLSFSLLQPLIQETVDKIQQLSPKEAQTGPARRRDVQTIQTHLDMLEAPLQKKIYQLLSESIKSTYEKEL